MDHSPWPGWRECPEPKRALAGTHPGVRSALLPMKNAISVWSDVAIFIGSMKEFLGVRKRKMRIFPMKRRFFSYGGIFGAADFPYEPVAAPVGRGHRWERNTPSARPFRRRIEELGWWRAVRKCEIPLVGWVFTPTISNKRVGAKHPPYESRALEPIDDYGQNRRIGSLL